jgi:hypothetical protein
LLPSDYRIQYPFQPWGIDPHAWVFYSTRPKTGIVALNYFIRSSSAPQPHATQMVFKNNEVAAFVKDTSRWKQHRERDLPRVVQSPLYEPILRRTNAFFRSHSAAQPAGSGRH